jgi:hypothetical protein
MHYHPLRPLTSLAAVGRLAPAGRPVPAKLWHRQQHPQRAPARPRRAAQTAGESRAHLCRDQRVSVYLPCYYRSFLPPHRSFRPNLTLIPCRQLIPVSQPSALPEVAEQPNKNDEYAHLFNERFKSIRRDGRPSSSGENEEDEITWLEHAVGNQGEEELDQIKPAKGKLTIQFGQR